jgi:rubrerythrin
MIESTKRTMEGLEKAMQAEMQGYHFYQMAAKTTTDAKTGETFLYLAEEEKGHFEFLKDQLDSIAKTGRVASDIRLGEKRDLAGKHPIFSDQLLARIGSAHYEMTALAIAIQLEQSAVEFYKTESEAAVDPAVKAFYRDLMLWEQGHLAAFEAEDRALKEDYWHEARFSPF